MKNPQSWWPIEQDYMNDGFAFTIDAAKPIRIHLKTGKIVSVLDNSINTYNGKMIDGGAATVLDMPLNNTKTLQELNSERCGNRIDGYYACKVKRMFYLSSIKYCNEKYEYYLLHSGSNHARLF
ncbi:MAG: hypothetical protein EAZ14_13340 [Runella slithyformis]|nr:MAG: hypothetical protein EAZ14_13340 [Runella slithyformis]